MWIGSSLTLSRRVSLVPSRIGKIVFQSPPTMYLLFFLFSSQGEMDNALVLFMSDNGAEGALLEALPILGDSISAAIEKYTMTTLSKISVETTALCGTGHAGHRLRLRLVECTKVRLPCLAGDLLGQS